MNCNLNVLLRRLFPLASAEDEKRLETALEGEEKDERAADRNYWLPLVSELEKIRHRKSIS